MSGPDDGVINFLGMVLICGGAIAALYLAVSVCMEPWEAPLAFFRVRRWVMNGWRRLVGARCRKCGAKVARPEDRVCEDCFFDRLALECGIHEVRK